MLDGGATISIVDSIIAKEIGLKGVHTYISIQGISNGVIRTNCQRVTFKVRGTFNTHEIEHAVVMPNLNLPKQTLGPEITQAVSKQEGVKIPSYKNVRITILLGQDNWPLLEVLEKRKIRNTGLNLSRTLLGWSIHGYIENEDSLDGKFDIHTVLVNESQFFEEKQESERLDRLIEYFFGLENLGIIEEERNRKSKERAVEILEKTSKKKGKTWETGLLWKSEKMPAIDSRSTARKRLYSLEKKLDRNPEFAALYYKEMDRIISKGYAQKVDPTVKRARIWYLPHFGVQNINKPGKVRVVFDAAARTEGVCFNDLLDTGPDLLESLLGVLLRFRQFAFAVKADIKDMFLCIEIIDADRGAQRFLWRGADRSREPDELEIITLIFGSTASPTSAIYVKNTNAQRFIKTKPIAAASIKKNSYMDDFLASAGSAEELKKQVSDVIEINSEVGFVMHGWASNDEQIVSSIREKDKLTTENQAKLCKEERVLGLYWDRDGDNLGFNVGFEKIRAEIKTGSIKPSKREVFSAIMSVYDPLGILSPFTIQAKLLIQDIWRSGISWDAEIRDEEFGHWMKWLDNLKEIKQCRIPRCLIPKGSDPFSTELHVFCDASLQAFATVAYLRVIDPNRTVYLSLIMAKTRIAPVKPITVPRLELQAALLASRMAKTIEKELDIAIMERFFWSDSTTVLHWIRSDPRKKQAFVANRLGEIGELTRVTEWHWVPTKMNPADDAFRRTDGVLKSSDRWCVGPSFLKLHTEMWPKQKNLDKKITRQIDELENRKEFVGVIYTKEVEVPTCVRLFGWHGLIEWARKLKVRVDRWLNKKIQRKREEEFDASKFWFREIQSTCFAKEIEGLKNRGTVPKCSAIIGLRPYLDKDGLLRAMGRVTRFQGENFQNEPIILDAKHFATKQLIGLYHRRYCHANNETVINELRQQFYIVGLRARLRWLAKKCIVCRLARGKPQNPLMADIPPCRLAYGLRSFTHCGVDYFGPMWVKIGRRREKRWGVLFTCMTTRAIHLELAATLDANSTIMALQRFSSRRGHPLFIYSDNATNFTRADKELQEILKGLDTQKQKEFAKSRQIKWIFNPPSAPHMGGAWERLVRSVKTALKYTLKESNPTEEVLWTVLVEIEHMVNSRPLTHVSTDPSDGEALTPNHFLIGTSSGYLRLDRYDITTITPRKRFEMVQNLAKCFWKKWLREYLPTLLLRKKWFEPTPPLAVGDIVQILDFQAPRNEWRTGEIREVQTDPKGNVRIAKIRVGKQEFVRPTHKLVKIITRDVV